MKTSTKNYIKIVLAVYNIFKNRNLKKLSSKKEIEQLKKLLLKKDLDAFVLNSYLEHKKFYKTPYSQKY